MASVGQVPSDEEVNEMIKIADADGSGSVDFCEFVTLMAHKMADVKSEAQIRAAFSLFDFSGDGYIQSEVRTSNCSTNLPTSRSCGCFCSFAAACAPRRSCGAS